MIHKLVVEHVGYLLGLSAKPSSQSQGLSVSLFVPWINSDHQESPYLKGIKGLGHPYYCRF